MTKSPPSPPLAATPAPHSDAPLSHPLRSGALSTRKPTRFDLAPDADTRDKVAHALGLLKLPVLRLKGEIRPSGSRDFVLEAVLTAVVIQPCAISLAPVPAELKETVIRRYVSDWVEPDADEFEMPEDDTTEAVPEIIDIGAVTLEALMLALPLYPRAPGVELGQLSAAPPGAAPIADADLKPFASLAALKDRLQGGDDV